MTQVTKISKEGFDVLSSDDKNLSYSSELASHSIYNIISVTIPVGRVSTSVKHVLGFVPKVWIFIADSDGDGNFLRRIPYLDDSNFRIDYHINDSNVVIKTDGQQSSSISLKIIIFTRSP